MNEYDRRKWSGCYRQCQCSWKAYFGISITDFFYKVSRITSYNVCYTKLLRFVARWPGELKVDPGWRTHSEIAHYIGSSPEGPFEFSDVAVKGDIEGKAPCNPAIHKVKREHYYAAHIPSIHKVDSLYALFFIMNTGSYNFV